MDSGRLGPWGCPQTGPIAAQLHTVFTLLLPALVAEAAESRLVEG